MFRADVLNCLYKQYRTDTWLQDLLAAAGLTVDQLADRMAALPDQMFLDAMTWQLAIEERMAGLRPALSASLDDRKAALSAKWRTGGKIGLAELQTIADSWSGGKARLSFADNRIKIQIEENISGVPELRRAIHEARPAHLPVWFLFLLLYIVSVRVGVNAAAEVSASFSPWRQHKGIILNGSYLMDGETLLNGVVDQMADHYPTAAWIGLDIVTSARPEVTPAVALGFMASQATAEAGWIIYSYRPAVGMEHGAGLTVSARAAARVAGVSAYIEKDWYTLDGSVRLDGAHRLCADRYTMEV